MSSRILLPLVLLIVLVQPVLAQDQANGRILLDFGYRGLKFAGSEDLYRSHVDLGEGPKLFSGLLEFNPGVQSGHFFDTFKLRMNSWGGDPYNTAGFTLGKRGAYEFNFDYKNFRYFSSVPNFANPFFESGNVLSQHRFDVSDRVFGLNLRIRPGARFEPFFAYQRTGRKGPVATTLRADGDEFLLRSDSDYNSDDFRAGVKMSLKALTLTLEQGVRTFEDHTTYQTSGFQEGNRTRPVLGHDLFLEDYQGRIDTRASIPFSRATATLTPHPTLTLGGSFIYGISDTHSRFAEELSGNFFPFPPQTFLYEQGAMTDLAEAKRPGWNADVYAVWQPHWRFRLSERFRSRRFHISGATLANMTFAGLDPLLGGRVDDPLQEENLYDRFLSVDRGIQEVRGRFHILRSVAIEAGHRWERKEVQADETFQAKRQSLLLGFSYRHDARNRFTVDYERGRSDDAIFRTDSSDLDRLRIRGHFSPIESLRISADGSLFDHDNPELPIDLAFRERSWGANLAFTPNQTFSLSASYQHSNFRHQVDFIHPETFQGDTSYFRERADYADLYLTLLLPAKGKLSLGYSVWGNAGNFPVTYHRPVGEIEFPFSERFSIYGRWNYHGYNEKVEFLPQSYRAHLLTVGFRIKVPDLAEFLQ